MKVQHLIIGAGPTGLGAAWRLQQRGLRDWALLEGGRLAGGLAQSVVDDHGFTWDLGGHVQFSHYEMFDQLMDDLLGTDGWLYHDRESWVWIAGRFVPYPFQLNLHRLPESERAACLRGLDEAAMAVSQSTAAPENFGEWIDRTFGAGIADVFMRPYNRKVWARDPELMDWRWIGDRVAVADVARVRENIRLQRDDISWGPNNRFRFPRRGGTGAVWEALAKQLTSRAAGTSPLLFCASVKHVDTTERRVALADGREFQYEQLISTMPLDRLVAMSDLARDLRAAARDLEYSSTHVIGIGLYGTPPAALAQKCWMYFPEANCPRRTALSMKRTSWLTLCAGSSRRRSSPRRRRSITSGTRVSNMDIRCRRALGIAGSAASSRPSKHEACSAADDSAPGNMKCPTRITASPRASKRSMPGSTEAKRSR